MQLDWLTVAAQIVNFLVLVYLLKRFLYGPILQAMDDRQAGIAARLQEADAKVGEADRRGAEYEARHRALAADRDAVLEGARQEAEAAGRAALEEARQEVAERRAQWLADLQGEQGAFARQARETIGRQATGIARRVLHEIAGAELEAQVVQQFCARLAALSAAEQAPLHQAASRSGAGLTVASAFPLREAQRRAIVAQLHDLGVAQAEATFVLRPELVCGVVLEVEGWRWGWNVAGCLAGVEAEIVKGLTQAPGEETEMAMPEERRA
jgi:F-type H+-transporting ATPase subunit b